MVEGKLKIYVAGNLSIAICYRYSFIKRCGTPHVTANQVTCPPLWIGVVLLERNRLVSSTCSGVVRVLPAQFFGNKGLCIQKLGRKPEQQALCFQNNDTPTERRGLGF